jgi:predicted DCC family thiol-disulfide oxidoreductase YuxK
MSANAIDVYYDGACPICLREVRMIRRLDRKGRIGLTDFAAQDFDAAAAGIPMDALMERIHGRLADGTLVTGVEVFRRIYAAIGFSWLVALTRVPGIRQLLDLLYTWFARNRPRLTGRCDGDACGLG